MSNSKSRSIREPLGSPEQVTGPEASRVRVSRGRMVVDLKDGRTLIVPLSHFPGFDRLPPRAFRNPELLGTGYGVHFPAIDEYVSIENLFLPPDQLLYSQIPPRMIDRRPRPVHTQPR